MTPSSTVGDLAPLALGRLGIVLGEGRGDEGRDHPPAILAGMSQGMAGEVHDPNAIDALRFKASLAFIWPAIARPRQRHPPGR
jgi:hypothetical protein